MVGQKSPFGYACDLPPLDTSVHLCSLVLLPKLCRVGLIWAMHISTTVWLWSFPLHILLLVVPVRLC